jgi:hypothetical protein
MASRQSLPVLIASTLCYLWGTILLLVALASAAPIFSRHGFVIAAALFPLIVLIVAVTYCVTGYFIGRRRRLGAWLGVTVATLTALLQFVMHLDIMWISLTPGWLIVDTLLLVVLLANWRRFDQSAPGVH